MMRANSYGEQLRWAAFEAVCRGWPVVPGRVGTGPEGVADIQPLIESGNAAVTDPDHAWDIWGQQAYGVLLVRRRGIDVLDVPFRVAELLPALPGAALAVPVATALAPSRWRVPPLDDGTSAPPSADEVQRVLAEALRSGIR